MSDLLQQLKDAFGVVTGTKKEYLSPRPRYFSPIQADSIPPSTEHTIGQQYQSGKFTIAQADELLNKLFPSTPSSASATQYQPSSTQNQPSPTSFGSGTESAVLTPELFDALIKNVPDLQNRILLAELAGHESSYGRTSQNINPVERSFGPYQINIASGRKDPWEAGTISQQQAMDPDWATRYALYELQRTGGLGGWNPGAYDFYQNEIPKKAKQKLYKRGS